MLLVKYFLAHGSIKFLALLWLDGAVGLAPANELWVEVVSITLGSSIELQIWDPSELFSLCIATGKVPDGGGSISLGPEGFQGASTHQPMRHMWQE